MEREEDGETERNTNKNLGNITINTLTPGSRPRLYRGVSWYTPIILPLERMTQEHYKFKSRLGYIAR